MIQQDRLALIRIVETGDHDTLIARGGYYAQLHAALWRGGEPAD